MSLRTLVRAALALTLCATAAGAQPPDDPIVATMGGTPVRLSEVDARWREQDPGSFARLQQETYESRRRALDSMVGAHLLGAEAARRGLTVAALLDRELPRRMPDVTEADILEAYARSGVAQQGVTLDQAREALVDALEKRRSRTDALRRYVGELRDAGRDVTVTFDAPRQTVAVRPGDALSGAPTARIDVVEFGDFQCPICRTMQPVLARLRAAYRDRVRFVWKDFPLPGHPDARLSAEAARCAADQGRFWEYHDRLFDNQAALGKGKLKDYAKQLKLNPGAFNACVDGSTHAKDVEAALADAALHGVTATPTVFINGRLVVGAVPYETYDAIVQEELRRPRPGDAPK